MDLLNTLLVLVFAANLDCGHTFIFEQPSCVIDPPCQCSFYIIECDNKSLKAMPQSMIIKLSNSNSVFRFQNNKLTTLKANSFINVTMLHNSPLNFIELKLYNNNLKSIETGAFNGITDYVNYVDLTSNSLREVPSELTKLRKLEQLHIQRNPISTLSPSTFQNLAKYFNTLALDLRLFQSWPTELNNLRNLRDLFVINFNGTSLDTDAFDAYKDTLEELDIDNSELIEIPSAVCSLRNIKALSFSRNSNFKANNLSFCNSPLFKVFSLHLEFNDLSHVPAVFSSFPNLTALYMSGNQFSFIDSDKISDSSQLRYLRISHNEFTRIPFAIRKFKALSLLNMQYNRLISIEETDLAGLTKLEFLYMNNNPIEYISSQAFKDNILLIEIMIQYTNLRVLPTSLTLLPKLKNLYLDRNPTTCNCLDMAGLRSWNISGLSITGTCSPNSISVRAFIENGLQRCRYFTDKVVRGYM